MLKKKILADPKVAELHQHGRRLHQGRTRTPGVWWGSDRGTSVVSAAPCSNEEVGPQQVQSGLWLRGEAEGRLPEQHHPPGAELSQLGWCPDSLPEGAGCACGRHQADVSPVFCAAWRPAVPALSVVARGWRRPTSEGLCDEGHLFGGKSSPSVVNYCMRRTAEDNEADFSELAVDTLRRAFYMDDMLQSVDSVETAKKLVPEMKRLLQREGFTLAKFMSTEHDVINSIQPYDRAKSLQGVSIENATLLQESALSLQWNVEGDFFTYLARIEEKPYTRCGLLSTTAGLYDPLGLIAPIVLVPKLIQQKLCRSSWDGMMRYWKCRRRPFETGETALTAWLRFGCPAASRRAPAHIRSVNCTFSATHPSKPKEWLRTSKLRRRKTFRCLWCLGSHVLHPWRRSPFLALNWRQRLSQRRLAASWRANSIWTSFLRIFGPIRWRRCTTSGTYRPVSRLSWPIGLHSVRTWLKWKHGTTCQQTTTRPTSHYVVSTRTTRRGSTSGWTGPSSWGPNGATHGCLRSPLRSSNWRRALFAWRRH